MKWVFLFLLSGAYAQDALWVDAVSIPDAGRADVRLLTPDLLELRWMQKQTSWAQRPEPAAWWENEDGTMTSPPPPQAWRVEANGQVCPVSAVGWKRFPVLADPNRFDLLLEGRLFLRLADPLPDASSSEARWRISVEPAAATANAWPGRLAVEETAARFSPALHFNRHGFAPSAPKFAFVSYDLGALGEMDLPDGTDRARLRDAGGHVVAEAALELRREAIWPWSQKVWRADFSDFTHPGEYTLEVPGVGRSGPWRIFPGAAERPARLLAGALYHQRSGENKGPPFTRFAHPASHLAPAFVPNGSAAFAATNRHLAAMSKKNTAPDQVAPPLDRVEAGLYPFVRTGRVPVHGGHHDAGDYSKYTINSAQMIHHLLLAADYFPGGQRANFLGLPEGVGGREEPDLLRLARPEVEFLLRMQDADGGFYFLVYPRDRPYELDVLPHEGDPQVVFPKTTAATAAATGALAQVAASPLVQRQDPALARRCLAAAREGWAFLERAVAAYGEEGSYQAISHYGNFAGHRDEMAFAAAGLLAATGEEKFATAVCQWWPTPLEGADKKWGWWPLFEFYGSAARLVALSEKARTAAEREPAFSAWRDQVKEVFRRAARTWLDLATADAYGLPISAASKRQRRAGWFWAMDPAVDVLVAWLLFPTPEGRRETERALAQWAGYEAGGNPLNQSFFGGDGPRWRRHVVNRLALNDDRQLAPPGLPIGQLISSPQNLRPYQIEGRAGLRSAYTPSLEAFPLAERSTLDTYNVREEWTIATGARLLAAYIFLAGWAAEKAEGDKPTEPWMPPNLEIIGLPETARVGEKLAATLRWPDGARPTGLGEPEVVWEWIGSAPQIGPEWQGVAEKIGEGRLEVEVVWPDGRRVAAVQRVRILPRETQGIESRQDP